MPANNPPTFLLASREPALLAAIEPVLLASGARVEIVRSADAALAAMNACPTPSLALLDERLPFLNSPTEFGQDSARLLASIRAQVSSSRLPIVLIADKVNQEWSKLLAEGVIDDLIPRTAEPAYWPLRLDLLLRHHHCARELEIVRERALLNAQLDHLTGVYNRETILSMLFRETDRVQRIKSPLSIMLLDIDDFGHWNLQLGADACDELLCQIVGRTSCMLRTYDLLGRPGLDQFLLSLPGCNSDDAAKLAERLRIEVFGLPFQMSSESVRLSACFGIASSQGRSPMVVLREAEQALQWARATGPESIQCF